MTMVSDQVRAFHTATLNPPDPRAHEPASFGVVGHLGVAPPAGFSRVPRNSPHANNANSTAGWVTGPPFLPGINRSPRSIDILDSILDVDRTDNIPLGDEDTRSIAQSQEDPFSDMNAVVVDYPDEENEPGTFPNTPSTPGYRDPFTGIVFDDD